MNKLCFYPYYYTFNGKKYAISFFSFINSFPSDFFKSLKIKSKSLIVTLHPNIENFVLIISSSYPCIKSQLSKLLSHYFSTIDFQSYSPKTFLLFKPISSMIIILYCFLLCLYFIFINKKITIYKNSDINCYFQESKIWKYDQAVFRYQQQVLKSKKFNALFKIFLSCHSSLIKFHNDQVFLYFQVSYDSLNEFSNLLKSSLKNLDFQLTSYNKIESQSFVEFKINAITKQ